ncbi:MAG: tRNA-(ms[2]io[6]A)-hydroxylase [Ignavibacteria bacterium]|nr:tRNA-(ms[2]io[6]A)-hydroxylase [Ignavibacteria bacterium]
MLCLQSETNSEWIDVACANTESILVDHALCEKKAAAFALALITRYPKRMRLIRDMIALAQEELEHFDMVMQELEKRGLTLSKDVGNPYANALHKFVRQGEPKRLLDSLIVGAFIEARSCERFSLLSKHAPTDELRQMYGSLLASEAGHYRAYTDIAREYFPVEEVRARIKEFADYEADVVKGLANQPTVHG